jgi:hypothetical protein
MKTQAYFVMLWLLHAVAWAQSFTPQSFAPPFSYRISSDFFAFGGVLTANLFYVIISL